MALCPFRDDIQACLACPFPDCVDETDAINDKNSLGNRIKKVRHELKITQREFGERIGVKAITVNKWERGVTIPNAANMALLYAEYPALDTDNIM